MSLKHGGCFGFDVAIAIRGLDDQVGDWEGRSFDYGDEARR